MWLDDLRPVPDGWVGVKTVDEAIAFLTDHAGQVSHASLDHDLGEDETGEMLPEGYELCLWLAEQAHNGNLEVWPTDGIRVHSDNSVGAPRMVGVLESYGPYGRAIGRRLGTWT